MYQSEIYSRSLRLSVVRQSILPSVGKLASHSLCLLGSPKVSLVLMIYLIYYLFTINQLCARFIFQLALWSICELSVGQSVSYWMYYWVLTASG